MKSAKFHPFIRLSALILAFALLTACGAPAAQPLSPASSSSPSTPSDSTSTSAGSEADSAFSLGGGDFNLPDPAVGLDGLEGYTAVLTLSFEGQQAGVPQTWTRIYRLAASAGGQPAVQVEVSYQPSADAAVTRLLAAENNVQQAVVENGGACQSTGLDEVVPLAQRWQPARLLPGVAGAQPDGEEDVQGGVARRYTFDERALGLAGLVSAEGTLWIDPESGVVLRYSLSQQGGEEYFGEGVNGRLTWEYTLDRAGAAPAWPPGCAAQSAGLDLPLPPGAVDVDSSPGMLSFHTPSLPGDVLAFYEPLLAEAGWISGANQDPGTAQPADGEGGTPAIPGLEDMLDEETLQQLEELQAMQDENWMAEMGEDNTAPAVADPSSAVTAVYHREALELTLTILPQENQTLVILALIQP